MKFQKSYKENRWKRELNLQKTLHGNKFIQTEYVQHKNIILIHNLHQHHLSHQHYYSKIVKSAYQDADLLFSKI